MSHRVKESQTGSECDQIVEQRILKDEEKLRLDSRTQMRRGENENKANKFNVSGKKISCVPKENLERVRKGRGSSGYGRRDVEEDERWKETKGGLLNAQKEVSRFVRSRCA